MSAAVERGPKQHPNLAAFLVELTDITHKYQIAISGHPVLVVLDRDDYALQYSCDDDGQLTGA